MLVGPLISARPHLRTTGTISASHRRGAAGPGVMLIGSSAPTRLLQNTVLLHQQRAGRVRTSGIRTEPVPTGAHGRLSPRTRPTGRPLTSRSSVAPSALKLRASQARQRCAHRQTPINPCSARANLLLVVSILLLRHTHAEYMHIHTLDVIKTHARTRTYA